MNLSEFKALPNRFFYFVSKQYLKYAYPNAHTTFFDFEINRRAKGKIRVKCFNGGAWVYLDFAFHNKAWRIKRTGNYPKHNRVNSEHLIKKALSNIDNIPEYYSVRYQENISTYVRCVSNIEQGKKDVILQNPSVKEPVNWIIELV